MTLLSNMFDVISVSASNDWETVKNVFTGNSSSKPDRTDRDGKVAKQSKMLNNSAYSRLGNKKNVNNFEQLLTLFYNNEFFCLV